MKIEIFIPSSKNFWKIQISKQTFLKRNAIEVIAHLEYRVRSRSGSSIEVVVENDVRPIKEINSGIYARKSNMVFAAVCFLEEYLPAEYRKKKLKKYAPRL